jgi:hypothetical protein
MDITNLKSGDIVICIDSNFNSRSKGFLTKGNKYKVINSNRAQSGFETYDDYITVVGDDGGVYGYLSNRFTTIEDWRDNKLNEIL